MVAERQFESENEHILRTVIYQWFCSQLRLQGSLQKPEQKNA